MSVLAVIRAKMYSGTAMFRSEAGKIKMLEAGNLSLRRIISYALQVIWEPDGRTSVITTTELQRKATEWIVDHPEVHERAIPVIASYLHNPLFEWYVLPLDAGALFPKKIWPVRANAQGLLKEIAEASPGLANKINDMLSEAPPISN